MTNLKRFDTLEISTSDLKSAAETYQNNFGLNLRGPLDGDEAFLTIGDSEIKLISGAGATDALSLTGEGMVAIYLEAEDVNQVAAVLDKAGFRAGPIKIENRRRVLAIDPKLANQVPLFIFDRKV